MTERRSLHILGRYSESTRLDPEVLKIIKVVSK